MFAADCFEAGCDALQDRPVWGEGGKLQGGKGKSHKVSGRHKNPRRGMCRGLETGHLGAERV